MKENIPNYKDRRAIFPGSSCFPLSPKKSEKKEQGQQKVVAATNGTNNGGGLPKVRQDQIQMIFSVIGTPTKNEIEFIQDQNAKKYIQSFDKIEPLDLTKVYPASDDKAINILQQIFKFNPKDRSTIDQLLENSLFNQFRRKEEEAELNKIAKIEMELEFEEVITSNILRQYYTREFAFYLDKK